ncbi:MAG: SGNH/GDSL hydrolase family protein [Candidatus Omnitrophica bacterium]|nr:SGNH/GDSL hydrolase family protein [Candidatus Omnitrophota bacterium]
MNQTMKAILVITILSAPAALFADESIRWISFPDPQFEVNGLPWFEENSPDLYRLPKRAQTVVRKAVWGLGTHCSGARIRFKSDCTALAIRYNNLSPSSMQNMHVFGQSGIDLYVDGVYAGTAVNKATSEVEHVYFQNAQPMQREYVLYLPLYNGAAVSAIGVNPEALLEKAQDFSISKPVVYYGTSITQGGCASRAGMSYQAILGRRMNVDFVNLGFSGNGKGEKEVADLVAEIDASCFVMDFMANNKDRESLEKVYGPFVRTIRAKHPSTPILLVTRIYATREEAMHGGKENIEAKRDVIRKTAAQLIGEGDKNIHLLEGYDLLGPTEGDGLVDGSHPNDLGFQIMADRLQPILSKILIKPKSKRPMRRFFPSSKPR